jgi:Spx/MgsR family transcriptional regulator
LVATRGRPWSDRALALGVRMARRYRLEIVIIAVLTPTYVPEKRATWGIAAATQVGDDVRRIAERVLEEASDFVNANGVKHVCEIRQGRPAEEIIKAAEQHQCDLIIIGSRGLSGVRRVTMGETGNEVVLKAPMPVIVVKWFADSIRDGITQPPVVLRTVEWWGGRGMAASPVIFYHKSTWTTCRNARSFLRDLGVHLQERDLGKEPLSEAELGTLIGEAEVTEFLNTRSASYRQHGFKGQPPSKARAIALMAQDPNLIKRPITVKGHDKVVGFDATRLRQLISPP